jgi:hypothetical protein
MTAFGEWYAGLSWSKALIVTLALIFAVIWALEIAKNLMMLVFKSRFALAFFKGSGRRLMLHERALDFRNLLDEAVTIIKSQCVEGCAECNSTGRLQFEHLERGLKAGEVCPDCAVERDFCVRAIIALEGIGGR